MNNLGKKIFGFIFDFDEKWSNNTLSTAIKQGFTYMIPFVFIGSFALLFMSLPISQYQNLMEHVFGSEWKNIFSYMRDGTYNILSLIMVVCISYSYAIESNKSKKYMNPITAAMVSLGSFVAISGINKEGFSLANFGVIGVFIALITAVLSSLLFFKLRSIIIFRFKILSNGADANLNNALISTIPAMLTIAVFATTNQILSAFFNISDIQVFLSQCLYAFFSSIDKPFWVGFLFILFIHIFWFFGIHGSNMLEPVANSIFIPALTANQHLVASGHAPSVIFTKTFFDTFVLMGGCGTGLCLILAILITGRQINQRRLSQISFFPVLFNINELMVFGIPIVLNPTFIIPFIGVPLILTSTSYLAISTGLVPHTTNLVEWTTPIFLSGYISTGSVSGSVMQLFNLAVGTLCYIPFVKLSERVLDMQLKNNMTKVYEEYRKEVYQPFPQLLERHDDVGRISKSLTAELEFDLQKNNIELFYQPISDYDGNVIFVEALLRWDHSRYGYINPSLIIGLAEEAKMMPRLGYQIFNKSCADLKAMNEADVDVILSINVSASQLEEDIFVESVDRIIHKHGIDPKKLQIEITEGVALSNNERILRQVKAIKNLGVGLAMDDFGMGHSSLRYLKEYDFDTIKLDGSLIREIAPNQNCRDIVSSIVSLGKSLKYTVIAEYVDSPEQKAILNDLGCGLYQGHLFSPALPCEDIIEYILRKEKGIVL